MVLDQNLVQPYQTLVTPLLILNLYPLFNIVIVASPDVLLLHLNDRAALLAGTGITKDLDGGLDMMAKVRSLM